MKGKVFSALTAVFAACILGGCASGEAKALKDMDVDKYVTLGEYKGLEVSIEPAAVDEDELTARMHEEYDPYVPAQKGITDRAVENGDTVNLDYEGKKDGVAFGGGTAQGSVLGIGSGSFIAGFEEGLVGVMPGETVDLNLTFPENYGAADLAGQEVVFTVTVNFILPVEMEDEIVPAIGIENVNTVDELREYSYDTLYEEKQQRYDAALPGAVIETFMGNCVFEKVPEEMVEKYKDTARENITKQAAAYQMDANTFTMYAFQMDFETFLSTYAEEAVKQNIAMQAVANRENLNIDDEELDALLLERAKQAGYGSVEEFVGETPRENYREALLYDKVLQYLIDNANI